MTPEEVTYIGDDLNNLKYIEYCEFSAYPNDAFEEVKDKCNYVCKTDAGEGTVRELIEKVTAKK